MQYSRVVPNTGNDSETPTHRHPAAINGLVQCAEPDITNIYEGLLHSLKVRPDVEAMGKRDVLEVIIEDKAVKRKVDGKVTTVNKKWSYFRLSEYKWMTYRELHAYTKNLGSGFIKLGLGSGSRMLIYAPTSREWQLCSLGCFSQSLQIVTAYDTLGESGVLHSMNQGRVDAIFLKADQLPTLARIMDKIETIRHVIYFQDKCGLPKDHDETLAKLKVKFTVSTIDEVHKLGEENPVEINLADGESIAIVMYTSGTTGSPKGVLIGHHGFMSVAGGIHKFIAPFLEYNKDSLLSFLPLSHVLTLFVDMYCVYSGIRIGYGTPRTLTDESVRRCQGDIKALQPSVLLGVPQVWNTIRAGILKQINSSSWFVRALFNGAVELKTTLRNHGMPHSFLDNIVFKKTREATGGRLKFVITGGAPINQHVQKLISAAVCPMIQGYGLTEASGLVSVQLPTDTTYDNVGPPCPSVECKLVDVPEADYYARNGQGEVWLRGPSIFKGYLDNDAEYAEMISEDGWLKTGDIGRWTEYGQLSIIDRKKNLVKLSHGEYIALESLEATYKNSLFVNNICVCADPKYSRPVAIVNIDEEQISSMADRAKVHYKNASELDNNKEFLAKILEDLRKTAKDNRLNKHETIDSVCIDSVLWTPENGMLTAASKLKRVEIKKRNAEKLDKMFKSMSSE